MGNEAVNRFLEMMSAERGASANTLAGMADVHFALYDEAVHFAAEAAGVTSFESNLVLLMDLLLLEATG